MIISDSDAFGGHEIMFLRILSVLISSPNISFVSFLYHKNNHKLRDGILQISSEKIALIPIKYRSTKASLVTAPLRINYGLKIRGIYRSLDPGLVLLIQGRIEATAVPMIMLQKNAKIVSYIPMAHSNKDMGNTSLSGKLMDKFRSIYYRRPCRFIAPSEAVVGQLKRAGATGKLDVVHNIVDKTPPSDRYHLRSMLQLPQDKKIALFMGRFDANQKGIDSLVNAIKRDFRNLQDWFFLFIGEGSDLPLIELTLIKSNLVDGEIRRWTDKPRDVLKACDLLLMPSRYEGVPLSMLEALADHVPLLTSEIDVFNEYLPKQILWDFISPPYIGDRMSSSILFMKEYYKKDAFVTSTSTLEEAGRKFESHLLN